MAKRDNNDPPEDDNLPDDFFGDEEDGDEDEEENEFMDEFEIDEPSEEDRRDFENERKERQNKITGHPVYKQAEEVFRMTEALVASMQPKSAEEDYDESMANLLMQSAMIICPKLAGAIGSENYTIAMQNAAIIRDNAEYLRLATGTLHHFTKVDRNHCKLHRAEMEKFRKIFCEWMNEVKNYEKIMDDEWNVF